MGNPGDGGPDAEQQSIAGADVSPEMVVLGREAAES